jgi:hypothetical protein
MRAPSTDLQEALEARAARMLRIWPPVMGAVPLCDAHRLLDQLAIKEALATCMVARAKQYGFTSLPKRNGAYVFPLFPALLPYLRQWVVDQIASGRLIAKAFDPAKVLTGKSAIVPANRIRLLVFDWERSTASINGAVVACEVTVDVRPERLARQEKRVASRVGIMKWLDARCKAERVPNQNEAMVEARAAFPGYVDQAWFRDEYRRRVPRRPGRPRNLQR